MISAEQVYRNAAAVHLPIGFKGMLKVKRAISLLMLCAVLVCCCGCNWNPFVGKRPPDYGDGVWICEEPKITYTVKMKYDEEQKMDIPESYAVTYIDGNEVLLDFGFIGNAIRVYELKSIEPKEYIGEIFLNGTCKFSETKFTVKVDTELDNLFDGQYDELVFVRQEDEQAN